MFKNKRRQTLDQSSSSGSSTTSPVPPRTMLTTTTTTGQATTLADSEYAQKRREIYKLLKKLTDLVGTSSGIRIPQIAVIGSQSAGKSSLVEAIADISVPRDSGTCTRCPMRCTVSTEGTEWSCVISVQEPDEDGKVSAPRPFSPIISSKGDVELWIRRAQTALLSPHAPLESFLNRSANELKTLGKTDKAMLPFTKGIVLIAICDPAGTELAFVDLPGLIQHYEGDNSGLVIDIVRNCVEDNIKNEDTVILVTVPATDDIETVQAVRLARNADPNGERTIAVVTKPDLLGPGQTGLQENWLNILQGRKNQSRLGYYSVLLPSDRKRENGLSRSQLDAEAHSWFSTKHPWKNTPQDRLGIPNLVSDISKLLMKIIQDSIPKIKQSAIARLDAVNQDIANLPPRSSTDAIAEISLRTSRFCRELHEHIYGQNDGKRSFVHSTRDAHRQYKHAIRSTMPDFRPFIRWSAYRRPEDPTPIPEIGGAGWGQNIQLTGSPMDLLFVHRVIEDYTGWELPPHVPSEAKDHLVSLSVDKWLPPALACFHQSEKILREYVEKNIVTHFSQFKALEQHMRSIVTSQLDAQQRVALKALHDVVARESRPYYTENDHYYAAYYSKWLVHYRHVNENAHRYLLGAAVAVEAAVADVPAYEPLPSASKYDTEMQVMASVRAYVQVAYKRTIDHVPRTIQRDLSQLFVDGLEGRLFKELKLGDANAPQRLQDLLLEDPKVAAKRKRLLNEQKVLEEVILTLNTFVI